jgi:SPP1 gp7 family putative phage head morphogenesis protein
MSTNFDASMRRGMTRGSSSLLNLKSAEEVRLNVSIKQQREIRSLYKKLAQQAQEQAEKLKSKDNISSVLRQEYLNKLANQLTDASDEVGQEIDRVIRSSMKTTAQGVVDAQRKFLSKIGMFGIKGAFSHVPNQIVTSIATGNIYDDNWTLSAAIWGMSKKTHKDIDKIIAEGVALNKSAYDIAKDLERYVNPLARKEWDWSKVYPGTNRVIDYNAQRLARTLVSHAYQQSLERTCEKNPFVTGYRWVSANSDRTCELCKERDGQIYAKGDLPLDHPNGLCTFIAVIPDSMTTISDRLADWVKGKSDSALDEFAKSLRK